MSLCLQVCGLHFDLEAKVVKVQRQPIRHLAYIALNCLGTAALTTETSVTSSSHLDALSALTSTVHRLKRFLFR